MKLDTLKQHLARLCHDGACLAFSGGTDSALLLRLVAASRDAGGGNVIAVTFMSALHPSVDVEAARALAAQYRVPHIVVEADVLALPDVAHNRIERCYACKKMLFERLISVARENGCAHVIDGTNADDLKTFRPGLRALRELGIVSPLADAGFAKAEIRAVAASLGMSVATKPSSPCLATRFPYDTELTPEKLQRVDTAERIVKELLGDIDVRVRCHGDTARLELPPARFPDICAARDTVVSRLRALGFRYVTLDLEGFRSGSMDA